MIKYEEHIYPFNSCLYYAVLHGRTTFKKFAKPIILIKSLAWYRCSTLMVPCATLSRYRSYHSLGTGTTEVI